MLPEEEADDEREHIVAKDVEREREPGEDLDG